MTLWFALGFAAPFISWAAVNYREVEHFLINHIKENK